MKNSYIHIRVPEDLKARVQEKARAESTDLTQVVTDLLVKWLKK